MYNSESLVTSKAAQGVANLNCGGLYTVQWASERATDDTRRAGHDRVEMSRYSPFLARGDEQRRDRKSTGETSLGQDPWKRTFQQEGDFEASYEPVYASQDSLAYENLSDVCMNSDISLEEEADHSGDCGDDFDNVELLEQPQKRVQDISSQAPENNYENIPESGPEENFTSPPPLIRQDCSSETNVSRQKSTESIIPQEQAEKSRALNFADLETSFDEEFQRLVKDIEPDLTIYKKADTFSRLSKLVRDFKHAATTYGKVIISEKHLPDDKKSIRPATNEVGGFAGGEKYIAGNIFFRFPLDSHKLYGGDALASKEANHQLKGVTALHCVNSGLKLPLVAVIRYLGYKLVAMSLLPIKGEETLCYGSSNGGRNLEDDALAGKSLIESAAKSLNLAKHPVRVTPQWRTQYSTDERWIHLPCDMEVHRIVGTLPDGQQDVRHYAVDFARLFPPQPPPHRLAKIVQSVYKVSRDSPNGENMYTSFESLGGAQSNQRGHHLIYMLRAELVRSFHLPLSSDAFSKFASRRKEHASFDDNVIQATEMLLKEIVPRVANELDQLPPSDLLPSRTNVGLPNRVIRRELHTAGVNMRFLGLVFHHSKVQACRQVLLLDAVSRVLKELIRAEMRLARSRSMRTAILTPYLQHVTAFLNLIFGAAPCQAVQYDLSSHETKTRGCKNCLQWKDGEPRPCRCCCTPDCPNRRPTVHPLDVSGTEKNAEMRANFWCARLYGFLQENFWFPGKDLRNDLIGMQRGMMPLLDCHCCVCLWKRCLPPALLFADVQAKCKIELSVPMQTACNTALDHHFSPGSSSPKVMCFDLLSPFQPDSDLIDLGASTRLLPIMEYAQGTEALIRAKLYETVGRLNEASYTRDRAKERFLAGLDICPWDSRLRCNLGMVLEDRGDKREALRMYLSGIKYNKESGRAWYLAARHMNFWLNKDNSKDHIDNVLQICNEEFYNTIGPIGPGEDPCAVIDYCFSQADDALSSNVDWKKEHANFLFYNRSAFASRSKAIKKAAALYEDVLALDPNHFRTLKNYANLLHDQANLVKKWSKKASTGAKRLELMASSREKLALAKQHLESAVSLEPSNVITRWRKVLLQLDLIVSMMHEDSLRTPEGLAPEDQGETYSAASSELSAAIEDLYEGLNTIQAFRTQSEIMGDPLPRYFDEGNQRRSIMAAGTTLSKVAKALVVCRQLFVPNSPCAETSLEAMKKCFDWAKRLVRYGCEPGKPDNKKLTDQLIYIYTDHIHCLLNILDPGFRFPSSTRSHFSRRPAASPPPSQSSNAANLVRARTLPDLRDPETQATIAEIEQIFAQLHQHKEGRPRYDNMYPAYRAHFFGSS